jgi:hypothetical protein
LLDPGESWKYSCTTIVASPGQITNTGTVRGKDPIGREVTTTDTAVVNVLDTVVLPVTGGAILRWVACGLSLIAGGSVLRRRKKP